MFLIGQYDIVGPTHLNSPRSILEFYTAQLPHELQGAIKNGHFLEEGLKCFDLMCLEDHFYHQ